MVIDIIKDNMEHLNINQKELAIITGLSEQLISEILSGKREIKQKSSRKLEIALNLPVLSLLRAQISIKEMKTRENDEGLKEISEFLGKVDKFKSYSKESLLDISAKKLKSNKLIDRKNDLSHSIIGFKKFKDKPLAYLWISILESKYSHLRLEKSFKKSSGPSVIKGALDIMIKDTDIDERINYLKKHLEKNGIILINAPFIPNSTIKGVSFKRNTQRFIFMSDMGKREYSYIFTLIHELMHYYYGLEDNPGEDAKVAKLLRDYFKKYNKSHNELELSMETFENRSKDKWDELHKKTKLKISFGDYKKVLF